VLGLHAYTTTQEKNLSSLEELFGMDRSESLQLIENLQTGCTVLNILEKLTGKEDGDIVFPFQDQDCDFIKHLIKKIAKPHDF
jgi:hypothetical protein